MANSNGFNAMFSIEFESFESVKKKLDSLQGKLNNELKNGAKIDLKIDTAQITKIMSDLSNLAKNEIKIMPNGEITTLSKFNAELGKTITLKQNLSKNETTIGISDDEEKKLREYTKLFDQAIKQEDELNKVKQSQRDSEWKEMETSYKQEQQFINASQTLKQKASQQTRANAEAEAKISNKLLEDQYKQNQSQKQEMEDAQKLIAYEKQRLDIRLKSINANRGSLVNGNYSAKIQDGINGLSGKSVDEVRAKTKQLNLELQKLDQQARMNGLQVGNKNIMSFGESVKSTATKLGIFASTAMVLNQVGVQFRNATNYVRTLDESMISLKKVTDETNTTYTNFLNNMHNVAMEFGTQSNYMVDAVTNWAKTGKTLEEASKLAESTILLTKVGDVQSVDTAQQYMIAPLKAFNIEAEKSIELIDKYNNISNNMSTTVGDVGDALSQSASSMATAGNSLEQTIAMIAAAESATKLGGNTIGNALKTMSMRLATFKDDETGEVIPKMAEQLKELTNVDITDMNGQLRNTYDIYMDIGKVYKELDKNSQLQINEILGGKRQGNIVGAILADTDELQRAFDLASNSAGSAMKEFETYQEGIQYSIDVLKEQVNGLYTSFINGGFIKGFVDGSASIIGGINSLTSSLGTIPVVITAVVGALTLFNSKFRESSQMMMSFIPLVNKVFTALNTASTSFGTQASMYSAQIAKIKALTLEYQKAGMSTNNFGKTLLGLNTKLALSTTAMIATKVAAVALQMAAGMLLTAGVSLLISGLGKLADSLVTTKSEMKELNDEFNSFSQTDKSSQVSKLITQYKGLQKDLSDTTKGTKEYSDVESELATVQEKIIELYPHASTVIDENTGKKGLNLEATQKLIGAELELAKAKADKILEKNNIDDVSDIEYAIGKYESYLDIVTQLNDMKSKNIESRDISVHESVSRLGETNINVKDLDVYTKRLEEAKNKLETVNNATGILGATNEKWAEANKKASESLGLVNNNLNLDTSGVDGATSSMDGLSNATDNAVSSIDELTNAFSSFDKPIQLLQTAIEEFQEFGMISTDTWSSIISSGNTELIALLSDSENFLVNAQGLLDTNIAKQEDYAQSIINTAVAQQNASNMVIDGVNAEANATVNAENSKINASVMSANNRIDNEKALVDANNKNFGIDADNFSLFATAKQNASDTLANGMIDSTKSMVDSNNSNYSIDASNYVDYINTKINAYREFQKAQNGGFTISRDIMKDFDEVKKIRDEYNQLQKDIANSSSNAVNSYSGSGGVGGGVGHGAIGSSGTGSGGSGSGSSATEKEVDNLALVADQYYKLNDLISDNSRLLEKNRNAQKNAHGQDLINLMSEEIDLMKQKVSLNNQLIDSYTAEANGAKIQLMAYGFEFDANNNLTNSYERLIQLKKEANSKTGVEKENAQGYIKTLETLIESFNTITNGTIPNLQGEIESINNSMKDLYKDQAELIAKSENDISKVIEYEARKRYDEKKSAIEKEMKLEDERLNKLKESLSKEKELYNKQNSEDDFNSNLAKERQKLSEIQAEIDRLSMATDAKSKAMLQSLMKDYQAQQDAINQMIKDKTQQDTNDRFDEENSLLDDQIEQSKDKFESILDELENDLNEFLKPENLSKLVQDGIVSGFITIGDETVNLTSAMKNMIQESTVGFTNMTLELNEFINGLKDATSLYSNFNNIISGANLSGLNLVGGNVSRNASSVNVTMGNLTIQGSVSDSNLGDIQSMLDKQKNDVIKEISKQLNSR